MSENPETLVERVSRGISAEKPAGEPATYEPRYEALVTEIAKLSSAAFYASVDWNLVSQAATEILTTKSKDLKVASYLCAALFRLDGYGGLWQGVEAVRGIAAAFWESLYPPPQRATARAAALQWLAESVDATARQRKPAARDVQDLERCVQALDRLGAFVAEKLGDLHEKAPGLSVPLGTLRRQLEELEASAAAAAGSSRGASPPGGPAKTAPGSTTSPPAAPKTQDALDTSTPAGLERALNRAFALLREGAGQLRKSDPRDPLAYRLARAAAWTRVTDLPDVPERETAPRRTRVPPEGVGQTLEEECRTLVAKGGRGEGTASDEWSGLLERAEHRFGECVYWLDAHRWVDRAMEALGREYDAARRVVRTELAAFLRRLPGVIDLEFSDGTPFASSATRSWIGSEVLGGGSAAVGGPEAAEAGRAGSTVRLDATDGSAGGPSDPDMQDLCRKAKQLADGARAAEAVALLKDSVEGARSTRDRFVRRLELARLLSQIRQPRLAIAHLEALDRQIAAHGLEEWEPALSAAALRLYLSCQRQLLQGEWKSIPEAQARAEELLTRLARLDPASSLT